jgi:hypothetical protein
LIQKADEEINIARRVYEMSPWTFEFRPPNLNSERLGEDLGHFVLGCDRRCGILLVVINYMGSLIESEFIRVKILCE